MEEVSEELDEALPKRLTMSELMLEESVLGPAVDPVEPASRELRRELVRELFRLVTPLTSDMLDPSFLEGLIGHSKNNLSPAAAIAKEDLFCGTLYFSNTSDSRLKAGVCTSTRLAEWADVFL